MYNRTMNDFERNTHRISIEDGYQKYRYITEQEINTIPDMVTEDKIIGIECLICGAKSFVPHDVVQQYCSTCEIYHFTPT